MSKNECSPKAAIFSDLISNFERVSDHATNIAFATFREEEYILRILNTGHIIWPVFVCEII